LCKEIFRQRFSAEKRSPRRSDAAGRILLPKFSVFEKGRPLELLSSCARCAPILQKKPFVPADLQTDKPSLKHFNQFANMRLVFFSRRV